VQSDTGRYATSQKLIACLTSADNAYTTDTTLSYIGATDAVQTKQAADADLKVWVEAVKAAKGRTSDDLGTKYPKISQPLWTAFQAALSGSASPADALKTAQTTAAAATK
jgi:multiple sugar transport system substrate-binding protein